jgi:hypothetical protein
MSRAIFATEQIVGHPVASQVLANAGIRPRMQRAALRGIANEVAVYEIP